MAEAKTYTISRQELRHVLVAFGLDEKELAALFSSMEKAHRHVNIISFISMLEKTGLSRESITNVLRRLGLDDLTISDAMSSVDEQRIIARTGRVYEATIDFG
ncbi:MAG: hypothetical protein M1500_00260 [Candidatus Marsarchaeota archaeon]|jgi:hypothetical protein|nr:hypothetical protein [Candidatus Marsarchaeota archaeon]MCL5112139.1 hypothetical protein [Candidatus Marsarchaeota archaeon]